jgi:hypothetical protein
MLPLLLPPLLLVLVIHCHAPCSLDVGVQRVAVPDP